MSNVQKAMTNVKADLEKHAFDLSERHLFSAKVGQLLPVYNKQVVPGDYFEINPMLFLRTMKLNTASFARMRQHLDFFFVPYVQLWHRFPEMKYQREDPTAYIGVGVHGRLMQKPVMSPFMTLKELYQQVLFSDGRDLSAGEQDVDSELYEDQFGFNRIYNRVRLCDLLGYGSLRNMVREGSGGEDANSYVSPVPSEYFDKNVNIWPWLAYQKIFADYYRNPFFDVNVDAMNFNVDDINGDNIQDYDIGWSRTGSSRYSNKLDGIFDLRYRQWKKDFFTGIFPSQQFGDVSMVVGSQDSSLGFLNFQVEDTDYSPTNAVLDTTNNISDLAGIDAEDNTTYMYVRNSGLSAIDIRRAELLQVWKEKTLRAGYRTQNQQMAHFGVRSQYIGDNHVQYLGGVSQVIDVNEVVSTSLDKTGLSSVADGLGELAGKGTSLNNGDKIRFRATDDGIIMCIFSILPESEYSAFGLAREHTRIDPFDYFTPATQNLGFQAITHADLNIISDPFLSLQHTLGYAPPYYDMKIGQDKVHGEFIPDAPLASGVQDTWLVQRTSLGALSAFDLARRDIETAAGTLNFFYVSPHVTDSVFAMDADNTDLTDQFYCNMYLDIKAVRPMSVLGLPNF